MAHGTKITQTTVGTRKMKVQMMKTKHPTAFPRISQSVWKLDSVDLDVALPDFCFNSGELYHDKQELNQTIVFVTLISQVAFYLIYLLQ